jgi:hypothetical protein
MVRVTNRGTRKWEIDGAFVRPGQTADVSADSWRRGLDLNPALAYAVGAELEVEATAQPATEPEPDYAEPAESDVTPEPVAPARRKKGRR